MSLCVTYRSHVVTRRTAMKVLTRKTGSRSYVLVINKDRCRNVLSFVGTPNRLVTGVKDEKQVLGRET